MIRKKRLDLMLRTNDDFGQIYRLVLDGEPVNLSNITSISMKIRRNAGGTVLATVTPTIIAPAADGRWSIVIPRATVSTVYDAVETPSTAGQTFVLEHDIVFSTATGQQVWFIGYVEIKKGITE